METKFKVALTFLVIVLLIAGLYLFTDWFSKVTGYFTGESEKIKLAKCLSDKGAEFYGSEFCAECAKQTELFGDSFKLISYINCGKNKELCQNIREIPAWYINKNIYYGYKNLTELKDISNCKK